MTFSGASQTFGPELSAGEFSGLINTLTPAMGRLPDNHNPSEDELLSFLEFQNAWTSEERIAMYEFRKKLMAYSGADEFDFLRGELLECKGIEDVCFKYPAYGYQILFWVRKYREFLEKKQIELEKLQGLSLQAYSEKIRRIASLSENSIKSKTKLRSCLNKVDTIGFYVLLKDLNVNFFENDNRVAKFLEEHVLFDKNKPLKYVIQEINKYRKSERNTRRIQQLLAGKELVIKTDDDFAEEKEKS